MEYKVEKITDVQFRSEWVIKGLPSPYDSDEKANPDSHIFPGLNYVTSTPEGLTAGLYEQLYGEYQINNALKEGDIFITPVGQFICEGVHVLPYDDVAKAALKAAEEKKEEIM